MSGRSCNEEQSTVGNNSEGKMTSNSDGAEDARLQIGNGNDSDNEDIIDIENYRSVNSGDEGASDGDASDDGASVDSSSDDSTESSEDSERSDVTASVIEFEDEEDMQVFEGFDESSTVYNGFVRPLIVSGRSTSSVFDCAEADLMVQSEFSDAVLERLRYHVARATKIKHVRVGLYMSQNYSALFPRLFGGPFENHSLEKLHLSGFGQEHSTFQDDDARAVSEYLEKAPSLSKLIISDFRLETAAFRTLTGFLLKSKCTELELVRLDIDMNDLIEFILLLNSTNLKGVRLRELEMGREACDALAKTLLDEKCALDGLDLWGNDINDECMRLICDALAKNKTIRHFQISANPLTSEGVKCLTKLVYNDSSLNSLADSNHKLFEVDLATIKASNEVDPVLYFNSLDDFFEKLNLHRDMDDCEFDEDKKWMIRRRKIWNHLSTEGVMNPAPFGKLSLDILPFALAYAGKKDKFCRGGIMKEIFFTLNDFYQIIRGLDVEQVFGKKPTRSIQCGFKRARIA